MERLVTRCTSVALLAFVVALSAGVALAHPPHGGPQAMLDTADTDGDGTMSRAEFISARSSKFIELDRNGDGYLSLDDAATEGRRPRRGPPVDFILGQLDTDGDELISQLEWESGPTPMFDMLDADGDGFVTSEEIDGVRERRGHGRGQRCDDDYQ